MRTATLLAACLVPAALVLTPLLAHAGQVHVNVANFAFTPRAANINPGDHVVWVWTSGLHTVTSGDSATTTPSGVFDSGQQTGAAPNGGPAFSWKADRTGTILYYCLIHAPGMAGRVIVATSPGSVPVSDFRVTEVQFTGTAATDMIEIANLGTAPGDLGRYRIAVNGVATAIGADDYAVPAGGRVVVHTTSGTNTATDIFLPGLGDLPAAASLALYVPNTVPGTTLTDATQMIDFVQWGAGGGALEGVAVTDGFWSAGQSVNNVATGHSIEFCGASGQYGRAEWAEIAVPNFGSNGNCTTPAQTRTWGQVKTLYR